MHRRNHEKFKLSYLNEKPNEFERANEVIEQVKNKVKLGDIDPVTAEKRTNKIRHAMIALDDCLNLVENAEPQKREFDRCHHSYLSLLDKMRKAGKHSSQIDRTIKAAMKYENSLDKAGDSLVRVMIEAKKTITNLNDVNTNNQLENQDCKKLADEIVRKRDDLKLCRIWSSIDASRSKDNFSKKDCFAEQKELIEAINKTPSYKS
jgi:hypothetical protein